MWTGRPLELVVVVVLLEARGLLLDAEVARAGAGEDRAAGFQRQRFGAEHAG